MQEKGGTDILEAWAITGPGDGWYVSSFAGFNTGSCFESAAPMAGKEDVLILNKNLEVHTTINMDFMPATGFTGRQAISSALDEVLAM